MATLIPWGLLWYDGDPRRPLEEKVCMAAERYVQKYGRVPNTCVVHPEVVGQGTVLAGGYRVVCHPTVLRDHFWIGEA